MKKYFEERFYFQKQLIKKIAPLTETSDIIEEIRKQIRDTIPNAMEVCILLLDPDADKYTRPLQCALYEKPVSCQACKRDRPAVQKAIQDKKAVIISESEPIKRLDSTEVVVGPEYAIPAYLGETILAVISVVILPLKKHTRKDFFFIADVADLLSNIILSAKRQWTITQEKIRISQMLTNITPFVPISVRNMVNKDPELVHRGKERKQVTVLFLDLEGYTNLSSTKPDTLVNEIIEKMFSSFIDPIHRSHGDINETAGDGLMIIFKDHDAKTNAINAVKASLEIVERNRSINRDLKISPPIDVNIGINSGTALVGMTKFEGSQNTRMTYTVSGTVTNIAARLSDRAKGGEILIGEELKNLIQAFWPIFKYGNVTLKGIKDPLKVYSLQKEIIR